MTSASRPDGDVDALLGSFALEIGAAAGALSRFGTKALGYEGAHDGTRGVQWNVWLDYRDEAAFVGVNLEGMAYNDWPIARFLERELEAARLFAVRSEVEDPSAVQAIWHRDAWQISLRPVIAEKHIGVSLRRLTDIGPDAWRATLLEAYACLSSDKGHRGRARQVVTTERHGTKEFDVSPHLQFRQQIQVNRSGDWRASLATAKKNLAPLHRWVAAAVS